MHTSHTVGDRARKTRTAQNIRQQQGQPVRSRRALSTKTKYTQLRGQIVPLYNWFRRLKSSTGQAINEQKVVPWAALLQQ